MMAHEIADKVRELLTALGSTSREVADTLQAKGVKGVPLMGTHCPIANYLKGAGIFVKSVTPYCVWAGDTVVDILGFRRGQVISDFICDFDNGDYPELYATKTEEVWRG